LYVLNFINVWSSIMTGKSGCVVVIMTRKWTWETHGPIALKMCGWARKCKKLEGCTTVENGIKFLHAKNATSHMFKISQIRLDTDLAIFPKR